MNFLERISRSALAGDALVTRSLLQDWLATGPIMADIPKPQTDDPTIVALAAGLAELFSFRMGQKPPAWTAEIGPAAKPTHLLRSASTMRRLREMCEAESPYPLRRRNLYAPSNYLETRA